MTTNISHFDERSGFIPCETDFGMWYQTMSEVFMEINVPEGTRARQLIVKIKPKHILCQCDGNTVLEGTFRGTVVVDDSTWSLEEGKRVSVMLTKSSVGAGSDDSLWPSLFVDKYALDPLKILDIRKKIDLEKMQLDHPGMDFSGARLDKQYDDLLPNMN